jgi:hypothetical protein
MQEGSFYLFCTRLESTASSHQLHILGILKPAIRIRAKKVKSTTKKISLSKMDPSYPLSCLQLMWGGVLLDVASPQFVQQAMTVSLRLTER